jgi:CheY-like chemotaxis protein
VPRLVIVVEDDPDNLDSIVDLLVEEGYDVISARTGQEARERLRESDPCVALVDFLLPDMTGGELMSLTRADRPGRPVVPFVILTAASQPAVGRLDAPVLKKPVGLDELLTVLRRTCATPQG